MPRRIIVCPTQEDLFEASAQCVAQSITSQPDSATFCSLVLAGGSTPRSLFARLTADPYLSNINWSSVQIFWGDERSVPPDHPESNFRMAKENLLDHLSIPSEQVFRIEGERSAEEAAVRYQALLQKTFSLEASDVPRFNLVLLGMGSDAHTASLFPETSVLSEKEQWVAAPWVEKFQTYRITLTPPVFNAAQRVLFVVSGLDKAQAAQAVLEGPFNPRQYPAQIVNPLQGDVIWLMDREAASQLQQDLVEVWDRDKGIV